MKSVRPERTGSQSSGSVLDWNRGCLLSQEAGWSHDQPTICIQISDVERVCFHSMKTHQQDVKAAHLHHEHVSSAVGVVHKSGTPLQI